jgi:hypothetical protein
LFLVLFERNQLITLGITEHPLQFSSPILDPVARGRDFDKRHGEVRFAKECGRFARLRCDLFVPKVPQSLGDGGLDRQAGAKYIQPKDDAVIRSRL